MTSLITSLLTGASGIYTNQTGVQVTGNNIANVNTAGYSRQSASITSAASVEQNGLLVGTGSNISNIERADNGFVTKRLIVAAGNYSQYEAASSPLGDIDQILSIDETSLASDIDNFFAAWDKLSNNPGETAERQQVLIEAEDLATHFHTISEQLSDVAESIDATIASTVPEFNDMLQQIAELNGKIQLAESSGADANTLQDQRDLLVQQVGEICGATMYEDDDGMACLQLGNGLPLVIGQVVSTVSASEVSGTLQLSLNVAGNSFSLNADALGGSLRGLLDVRDTSLPELQESIDQLAYELATAVNTLHLTGLDQNGDAATALFSLSTPASPTAPAWEGAAASIAVLINDPTLLATGTSGLSGDNSLSLTIADLVGTAVIDGATFSEAYGAIAGKAGLMVSSNEDRLLAGLDNLNDIEEDRDTLAGVSTDEEMLLLIQYQSGYEAAANYLSVVKEMLDTLLAM